MTMNIRRAEERGQADHGWLRSQHTFSFADYHDPAHMGYRALRVINEDRVAPGQGFGAHPHKDMEIISYVLDGAIAHKDSMGHTETLRPGEIQRMTAGTGVVHSEFNPSKADPLHFLQIWIVPEKRGLTPGYEQKAIPRERGKLALIGSPQGGDGAVTIHQDVRLYAGLLDAGQKVTQPLAAGRHAWVHVVRGEVEVNGQKLAAGDAAAIDDQPDVTLAGVRDGEVLVFDLA
jgi:redox-sensitive bicupin YhaK (pirin superfamily)